MSLDGTTALCILGFVLIMTTIFVLIALFRSSSGRHVISEDREEAHESFRK